MTKIVDLVVPNIGDFKNVEIIEILIKENQSINKNQGIITLESDKSSVEVPSQFAGKVKNIKVKVGDKVSQGDKIGEIELASDDIIQNQKTENRIIEIEKEETNSKDITILKIPKLGTEKKLIVSEILIKENQIIHIDQITLLIEDDENAYEIPSPVSGIVKNIKLKKGQEVKIGDSIAEIINKSSNVEIKKPII
ncbi:MAG: hypothetical protein RLZ08_647, partial [Pseudomonadota bacterium]